MLHICRVSIERNITIRLENKFTHTVRMWKNAVKSIPLGLFKEQIVSEVGVFSQFLYLPGY
jgi:hypothetical protein